MPAPPIHAVVLAPHPETQTRAVHGIGARLSRTSDGTLAVTYRIEGELNGVRVPGLRPARPVDGLWQHTCCEIFIARKDVAGYHEFNLAPSGEWAAYRFERYRERAPLNNNKELEPLDPQIAVRHAANALELDALIALNRLSPRHADGMLSLALAVVVEDRNGLLSYWALRHPPGQPDFHHPHAFALELA
jgi:hypothetical protein